MTPTPPGERSALPDRRTEKQRQQGIKRVLRDAGFWFVDTSQPFRAAITPGLADLIVFGRGRIAFVEVKTDTGKLTSAQQSFRAHVEGNGGEYLVWRNESDAAEWMRPILSRRAG